MTEPETQKKALDPEDFRIPPPSFYEAVEEAGITFEGDDLARLGEWLVRLAIANETMNLTRITDPSDAWHRQVFDSLTLLPFIAEAGATSILDIGSGGGAPGLPLAIVLPDVRVGLVEVRTKKAWFLHETATACGCGEGEHGIEVFDERAETLAADGAPHRAKWDIVTARAVGKLPVLLELTIPFLKVGGLLLATKGEQAEHEVAESKAALHRLHATVSEIVRTPTGSVVIVEKRRDTPRQYPRAPGEPSRRPLLK